MFNNSALPITFLCIDVTKRWLYYKVNKDFS